VSTSSGATRHSRRGGRQPRGDRKLAENFSDAVVAPTFGSHWADLPAGRLQAINTADSRSGIARTHADFVSAAARLDDLVNLPPRDCPRSDRRGGRDQRPHFGHPLHGVRFAATASHHRSPNAGYRKPRWRCAGLSSQTATLWRRAGR